MILSGQGPSGPVLFLCLRIGGDGVLLKACPRCKKLIPHGLPYCMACAPLAEAERQAKKERREAYLRKKYNRTYNQKRDPKYAAFYRSKAWKDTSRAKLQGAGWKCEARLEGCQRIASEVHHETPIKTPEGWEKRLEWSGLRAVCTACHNKLDKKGNYRKKDPNVLDCKEIIKKL